MTHQFKFEHVVKILLQAEPDASPHELAERVRREHPKGTYKPVRICEDIDHILRRDGRFRAANVVLTSEQRLHIIINQAPEDGLSLPKKRDAEGAGSSITPA